MKYYELLYVLQPTMSEEDLNKFINEVGERIKAEGGEIFKNELWQKRNLAYPIKKFRQGYYVLVHYKAEPTVPKKIEDYLRIKEVVLRWINVNMLKKDMKQYQQAEAKKEDNGKSE